MHKWIRNERGDFGDVVIISFFFIVVGCFIWAMVSATNTYNEKNQNAPCSEFSSYITKDIPARCLKYFTNPKEATETAK